MRHHMFRVALTAVAVSVVLSHGALAASAEKGKIAFTRFGCWQCHGFEGQGSIATSNGKVLAHDPLPWDTFQAFVRTSNTNMPPFTEKTVSNEDLADIYAYLQSRPKPADYKTIPLLNP
jgi:mono/diheme cytochrome c family protein